MLRQRSREKETSSTLLNCSRGIEDKNLRHQDLRLRNSCFWFQRFLLVRAGPRRQIHRDCLPPRSPGPQSRRRTNPAHSGSFWSVHSFTRWSIRGLLWMYAIVVMGSASRMELRSSYGTWRCLTTDSRSSSGTIRNGVTRRCASMGRTNE